MIVAYAGRRSGSLPDGSDRELRDRVRRLLDALAPSAVVGAAADGGDLLVLETALAQPTPPTPRVVLPTNPGDFRTSSVIADWRERYDRAVRRVDEIGGQVESLNELDGEEAYRKANRRMLDEALALAGDSERAVGLVLAAEGEGEMITDFTAEAATRGVPVLRLDPAVGLGQRPSCLVAIGRECEPLYRKVVVPALENAQLRFRRADGEAPDEADLVIGVLATRHLLPPRGSILMLPEGTPPPADLSAVRHVHYRQTRAGISDDDAIVAWEALAPLLAEVGR